MTRRRALEMIQTYSWEHELPPEWAECFLICEKALTSILNKYESKMAKEVKTTCPVCGKVFTKRNNAQKYCSGTCGSQADRQNRKPKEKECECAHCHKTFNTFHKKKYCSPECRKEAYHQPKKRKKKSQSLSEVARLATEAGLTYGQYMTKYGYGQKEE